MPKLVFSLLVVLSACYAQQPMKIIQNRVNKPTIEFSFEQLEKPHIITSDKCYLVNSPKTEVICMLPSEYDKETNNYRIMLDIIKQYQISDKYYREIK